MLLVVLVVVLSTFALDDVDDNVGRDEDVGVVIVVNDDDDDDDGGLFDLIAIGCPLGSLYRRIFAITFDKFVVAVFFWPVDKKR